MTVAERIEAIATDSNRYIVNIATCCWEWMGACWRSGHPVVKVGGKATGAHRVFYEFFKGVIPKGFHVHHVCENRVCVNPAHLVAVTREEHAQLHAKLTRADVEEIRRLALNKSVTQQALAERFAVHQTTISAVVCFDSWKNPVLSDYDMAA